MKKFVSVNMMMEMCMCTELMCKTSCASFSDMFSVSKVNP